MIVILHDGNFAVQDNYVSLCVFKALYISSDQNEFAVGTFTDSNFNVQIMCLLSI